MVAPDLKNLSRIAARQHNQYGATLLTLKGEPARYRFYVVGQHIQLVPSKLIAPIQIRRFLYNRTGRAASEILVTWYNVSEDSTTLTLGVGTNRRTFVDRLLNENPDLRYVEVG